MNLDDALAAWADHMRLPDATAERIYRRITAPVQVRPRPAATSGLDPVWWQRFTADFTERLVSSTRPVLQPARLSP